MCDFVPSNWFKNPNDSSILITAFRTLLVEKNQLIKLHIHDYNNARILILYGQLKHLDSKQFSSDIDQNGILNVIGSPKITLSKESAWLLVVQPFRVDGIDQNEYKVKSKAGILSSIYSAINGRNMAFHLVFENVLSFAKGEISGVSDSFVNPLSFPKPDVSKNKLDFIYKVCKAIEKSEQHKRHRIEISLHWFHEAQNSNGLDEFIKLWIALESLGMPDSSNIKLLNQNISNAYQLPIGDVQDVFGIGKIFGLRCRIVHDGEDLSIHSTLSDYIRCLYVDVLFEQLGFPSEERSKKALDNPEFDLDALVHIKS